MNRSLAKSPADVDGFRVGGGGIDGEEFEGVGAELALWAWTVKLSAVGVLPKRSDMLPSLAFQPASRGMWACLPAA